jgi:hypothetical protein
MATNEIQAIMGRAAKEHADDRAQKSKHIERRYLSVGTDASGFATISATDLYAGVGISGVVTNTHRAEIDKAAAEERVRATSAEKTRNVKEITELLAIHGRDGNWNASPYMCGLYNGLELARCSVADGEPNYRNPDDCEGADERKAIIAQLRAAQPTPGSSMASRIEAATWKRLLDMLEAKPDAKACGGILTVAGA